MSDGVWFPSGGNISLLFVPFQVNQFIRVRFQRIVIVFGLAIDGMVSIVQMDTKRNGLTK